MSKTYDEIAAYFRTYNPSGGGYEEWHMWCQALASRVAKFAGTFVRDYETARAARLASGPLNTDLSQAPVGAYGFWIWPDEDHVALYLGNGIWFMGSRHVTNPIGGVAGNAGTISHSDFQARAGLEFAGWAASDGGNMSGLVADNVVGRRYTLATGGKSNGRDKPSTTRGKVIGSIAAGDFGDFNGRFQGDPVDGDPWWYRGSHTGALYSRTVMVDKSFDGIPDLGKWDWGTTPVEQPRPTTGKLDTKLPNAKWVGSPNYDVMTGKKITHFTLHLMDGTLSGTDATFNKWDFDNGTSTNYGANDTDIHQYVQEGNMAWGDGNKVSNQTGISIEFEGKGKATKATMDNGAKLLAERAKALGFGKLNWMTDVFPHNHWVNTACPVDLDTTYIVDLANKLNGYVDVTEPPVVDPPVEPPVEPPTDYYWIVDLVKVIRELIIRLFSKK